MPEPGPGQALVRNLYLSIDPTNRAWIGEEPTYLPPVGIGEVMSAVGLGRVVSSNSDEYPEGALVTGLVGWQEYTLAGGEGIPLTVLPDLELPIECMLGALGVTGITAWFGVEEIGMPQEGETFVVSAAAGAVGSVAGQLAKLRGARVVGIAGGAEKCAWLVDELGFDAAVDRHDAQWREQPAGGLPRRRRRRFRERRRRDHAGGLRDAEPERARAALRPDLRVQRRSAARAEPAARAVNRVLIKGFIVLDWFDRFPEAITRLGALVAEGKVKDRHTIVEGLERAPEACNMLFDGDNVGKLIVKLEE